MIIIEDLLEGLFEFIADLFTSKDKKRRRK